VSSRGAFASVKVNAASTFIDTSFEEDVIQPVALATFFENTNSAQEEQGQELLVKPVDLARQARIEGNEAQIVTIELEPGQSIRTRPGTMIYRTDSIQMKTHMPHGVVTRFFSNTPLFLVDYIKTGKSRASLALGARRPSKILDINMDDYGGQLTIRKGVFLVGDPNALEMGIKRSSKSLLAQFFGGQGFLLQTLRGRGNVLLRSGGVQIRKKLKEDESLRINPYSLVAFSNDVEYSATKSTSFNNVMFGEEGMYVTTVTGPGTVWLQGMNPRFFTRTEGRHSSSSSNSKSSSSSQSSSSSSSSRR
jgi:uncharacterized protein (AIM24 family)